MVAFGKMKNICLGFNVEERNKYISFLEFPLIVCMHKMNVADFFCLLHINDLYFILKKRNK